MPCHRSTDPTLTAETIDDRGAPDVSMPQRMQSPASSASSVPSSSDRPTINKFERLIWVHVVSPQCSPLVLDILQHSWYIETMGNPKVSREMRQMIETISSTRPIDRDSFIPMTWDNNPEQHLWWSWFTDAQLKQFQHNGT
eukprot:5183012-Amphidinium_carterae.1